MRLLAIAAAALAAAAPAPAQTNASALAPDYSKDSAWLCLPGRTDVCSTPLATTDLNPNGYGARGLSPIAKDPPLDCFHAHPTVSSAPGLHSHLNPAREERRAARRRDLRLRRSARDDGRLRQSRASRFTRLGEARQLLVRAFDPPGAGRAGRMVDRRTAAHILSARARARLRQVL